MWGTFLEIFSAIGEIKSYVAADPSLKKSKIVTMLVDRIEWDAQNLSMWIIGKTPIPSDEVKAEFESRKRKRS